MFAKISEIADQYRVSRDAVYLWIRNKKIPASCFIRIGGTIRVDKDQFERALQSGDLYSRPGRKPLQNVRGEDSNTICGRQENASPRWMNETASVMPDHPWGPDPEG